MKKMFGGDHVSERLLSGSPVKTLFWGGKTWVIDHRENGILDFISKENYFLNHWDESPVGTHCSHIPVRADGI